MTDGPPRAARAGDWDGRDRDPAGRPQNARPRDALGRPLPYDAPPELVAEREPEDVVRTPGETLARAQDHLDAQRPFPAHDVLEAAWKNGPPHERDLWQGLAQLCVGLTHVLRGNRDGAVALVERGAERLRTYRASGGDAHGVDLDGVLAWAAETAAAWRRDADVRTTPPLRLRGEARPED